MRNRISLRNIPTKKANPNKCDQILIVSLWRSKTLFKHPKTVVLSRNPVNMNGLLRYNSSTSCMETSFTSLFNQCINDLAIFNDWMLIHHWIFENLEILGYVRTYFATFECTSRHIYLVGSSFKGHIFSACFFISGLPWPWQNGQIWRIETNTDPTNVDIKSIWLQEIF